MTASNGFVSQNSTFSYHNGSAYVELAEVSDLDPGEIAVTKVYFPKLNNTNYMKSYKPGQLDVGDMKLELNCTRAQAALLMGFCTSRATKDWRVELSDDIAGGTAQGTRYEGSGFICGFLPFKLTDDDRVTTTVAICWTTLPTLTEAPS